MKFIAMRTLSFVKHRRLVNDSMLLKEKVNPLWKLIFWSYKNQFEPEYISILPGIGEQAEGGNKRLKHVNHS